MTLAFYNEFDAYPAEWLRRLIAAGLIAPGSVDARSIRDLVPADIGGGQAHFFAGIGGWSHALRLARWPDDLPVWTGSCPCQPFSTAGKRKRKDDERHLWPEWFRLIRECRPPVVFGEQVASPDGLAWFDDVSTDLEGEGYAVGAADLCAAGVGAPHIRQRLYFVAIAEGVRWGEGIADRLGRGDREAPEQRGPGFTRDREDGDVAIPDLQRREGVGLQLRERGPQPSVAEASRAVPTSFLGDPSGPGGGRNARGLPCSQGSPEGEGDVDRRLADESLASGPARGVALGDSGREGSQERSRQEDGPGPIWDEGAPPPATGATRGFWAGCDWVPCIDGKSRAVKPGCGMLAHGVPRRVGALKAYGNAIVPQVAATFIQAVLSYLQIPGDADGQEKERPDHL